MDDAQAISGSVLGGAEAARRAMALALPLLDAVARDDAVNGSGVMYVVIMDPALTPADTAFEHAVLLEQLVEKAPAPPGEDRTVYARFARAKARLSWLCGCDGSVVQALAPHRLRPGDTTVAGSVWLDGIVVAVSGALEPVDEACAGAIAHLLRAQARLARAADTRKFLES